MDLSDLKLAASGEMWQVAPVSRMNGRSEWGHRGVSGRVGNNGRGRDASMGGPVNGHMSIHSGQYCYILLLIIRSHYNGHMRAIVARGGGWVYTGLGGL